MRLHRFLAIALAGVALAASPASAATIWDEGVDGDLSDDAASPTGLAFAPGSNRVIGTMALPADQRDFITFTIGAGQTLAGLLLIQYVDVASGGPGNRGFHAINAGATSFVPSGGTAGSFLGGAHLDPVPSGTDLLPTLAAAAIAGTGFSVPLGPGTYSYVIQQTGPPLTAYTLDFLVTPEPSTALLVAGAIGVLAARRRG